MPEKKKSTPIGELKPGDTATIGEKQFALTDDESGLIVQQVGVVTKTFQIGGLLAKRAQLEAELAAVNELIAEHGKRSK